MLPSTGGTCALGAFALLILTGCANPVVDHTWSRYTNAGNVERARGNLTAAEEAHRRAVINAQIGHLGPEKEAIALHNLALVKRDLCKLGEAEQLFRRALELREKNPGTPTANLTGTIFESAQLQYDRGHYAEATALMERGLPFIEQMGIERMDPTGFAHLLGQYADALRRVARTADAEPIDTRAKALATAHGVDLQQKPETAPFNHPLCR